MNQGLLQELSRITEEEQEILSGAREIQKRRYTAGHEFIIDSGTISGQKLIDIRPHTRFVDFPLHKHNYIEAMYVCRGSITHRINGAQVVLRQGELLLLNQHVSHEIQTASREDVGINLMIRPEFFDRPYAMLGEQNLMTEFLIHILRRDETRGEYLHFKVAQVLPIQNLMENLIDALVHRQENDTALIQTTMGLLFMHLGRNAEKTERAGVRSFDDLLAENAKAYLASEYPTATLGELARRLNQSESSLSRLIKEKTGKTFQEHLQEQRFSRAIQLLSATDLPVREIIRAVGYENNSYFHRRFKELYGTTPGHYRQGRKEGSDHSDPVAELRQFCK